MDRLVDDDAIHSGGEVVGYGQSESDTAGEERGVTFVGVAQLTKALCNEWAPHGINVNAIAPGYVKTSLNKHVWGDLGRSAEILSRVPCGRWAEPEDMAGPSVFLASAASDYLHGVILPVDGGFMAR